MSGESHWHYATYRAINFPAEVTAEFSGEFPALAAAKDDIAWHIRHEVVTDQGAMALIALPVRHVLDVLAEWMSLPEERFLHYWPWVHEAYVCSRGQCAQSAYRNAVEMADYMSSAGIIPVVVEGTAEEFSMVASPSTWGKHIHLNL
jgi:hypothetical protein